MIVFDLSVPSSVSRVTYWMNVVASKVSNPLVVIVGTHKDKCAKWEQVLEQVMKENSGKKSQIAGGIAVVSGSHASIKQLKEKLFQCLTNSKTFVGELIPRSYLMLESFLREEKKIRMYPVISYSSFSKIATICGITEEKLNNSLEFLNYLGTIINFPSISDLKKYIILHPYWLVRIMSRLVTFKTVRSEISGIIQEKDISNIWNENEFPKEIHPLIFEILRAFEIISPIKSFNNVSFTYVVPCMLSDEKPTEQQMSVNWSNISYEHEYTRVYLFSFLAYGFFPQMIIRIANIMTCPLYIWKSGILGRIDGDSFSSHVLVEYINDDDQIKIQIQVKTSENTGHVLSMITSVTENLLRGWYPTTIFKRYATHGGEIVDIANIMERMLEGIQKDQISLQIPDLALHNHNRMDLKNDLVMSDIIGTGKEKKKKKFFIKKKNKKKKIKKIKKKIKKKRIFWCRLSC